MERWRTPATSADTCDCRYYCHHHTTGMTKGSDAPCVRSHKGVMSGHHRNKSQEEQSWPQVPTTSSHTEKAQVRYLMYLTRVRVKWRAAGKAEARMCDAPTTMNAESPELVLLAGRHDDVVQHTEVCQAVHSKASVVRHQGQWVPLQYQQPQLPQGAETCYHALQVCQVIEAQVQGDEFGPGRLAKMLVRDLSESRKALWAAYLLSGPRLAPFSSRADCVHGLPEPFSPHFHLDFPLH